MSTFQARVEAYTGSISDTASLTNWLTNGARFIIDLMSEDVLNEYATTQTVTVSGLGLASYRIMKALKNGYDAVRVDSGMYTAIQDSNSIHYSLAASPNSVVYNGKIYIFPNGGEVLAMTYPTVSYNDQSISNYPARMFHAVVLYAAMQALIYKASGALTSLSAISVPTAPSAPSFSFSDVTGQTVTLPSLPSYTKPTSTDYSLTNLSSYINTSSSEDLDKATVELNHQKLILDKLQSDLYNELNETNAQIQTAQMSLQKAVDDARMAQEAGIINSTKDLEATISEYSATLNKYGAQVQSYTTQVGTQANLAQQYLVILERVKVEFNEFISGVIGSKG